MAFDSPPEAASFKDIASGHEKEWISASRKDRRVSHADGLTGLALSGGGVRSATFALGVMQGLARRGLFRRLDYLSAAGGGSYISGWLTSMIRRSGFEAVEKTLSSKAGTMEAQEIQALRQATGQLPARRVAGNSSSILTWARNVLLNLLALVALIAAVLFVALSVYYDGRIRHLNAGGADLDWWAMTFGVIGAALLRLLTIRRAALFIRTYGFGIALGFTLMAATAFSWRPWSDLDAGVACATWLIVFCLLAWYPPRSGVRPLVAHAGSSVLAGAMAGGLLYIVPWRSPNSPPVLELWLILTTFGTGVLFYIFLMGPRNHSVRRISGRFCKMVLSLAALWLLVTMVVEPPAWRLPLWVELTFCAAITGEGLLKPAGIADMLPGLRGLALFDRISPFVFVSGVTVAVAELVIKFTRQYQVARDMNQVAIPSGLALALFSLFLFWRLGAMGFTMHGFHAGRIARVYLSAVKRGAATDEDTVKLEDLVDSKKPAGPYPLISAALDLAEVDASGGLQSRTVPFLFSPLFCGFEPLSGADDALKADGGFCPTNRFAGGISAASAMSVSEPPRCQASHPPSVGTALLWTVFDMRYDRWLGNPLRKDSWRRSAPLIGPSCAIQEGVAGATADSRYIRPTGAADFDDLGIYQLVKRRCPYIIACDATPDPQRTFENLASTIRRCRTDLGVEIELDLAPLNRIDLAFQMATIRYSDGEPGLLLYIKALPHKYALPEISQYAAAHPEFPSADPADGAFQDAEFEAYRRLGLSLAEAAFDGQDDLPTEQVFRNLRHRLQPSSPEAEPAAEPPSTQIPQELIDTVASRECILCAGSGLAAQSKLPTWGAFLEGLLNFARDKGIVDAAGAAALTATLSDGEFEAVADDLAHQIPREKLTEYVAALNASAVPSAAHKLLAQMPFLGAVNTNMDDLLGAVFADRATSVLVPANTAELLAALQSKAFFTLNIWGTVSRPGSLGLTWKEFRGQLSGNPQFKQFVSTLFLRYSVFFVGFAFDNLRDFFESLELPQVPERKHYAIVANSGALDPVKLRYLERSYNLSVVRYPPLFNFSGLPEFLERMVPAVRAKTPRVRKEGGLILRTVDLENIGPFRSLHLEFAPSWNLLLGNNGVGKTVVMRAIAAALCGENADPVAVTRLLRAGTDKGIIRIKAGEREYSAELLRNSDGIIRLAAASLSPLIHDNWLVLGFPALRSVPWSRSAGPEALRQDPPAAGDLLPILRGEADSRVASIKQWLVNLDWAASKEADPSPSRKLIAAFFEIMQRLTPDLRIKLSTIDAKKAEVMIETDGGIVPLESISQGTGSVMCWIGALLERLSETVGTDEPQKGKALVLIDEIDAHMHPKWQQLFVSAFREVFPSVQVIATTHSPLLVGSLAPEELWLLHRVPLRSDIRGLVHIGEVVDGERELVVLGPEEDAEEGQPPPVREEKRYRIPATAELAIQEDDVVEEREALTRTELLVAERMTSSYEGLRADQILTGPLFDLDTTMDAETAGQLRKYHELTLKEHRSEEDTVKAAEIASTLHLRMASPQERETARKAFELIQDFADSQLSKLAPEERQKVKDEVRAQLLASVTGTGKTQ